MVMLTGAGRNLPVEAKRHFNPELWEAASTQLQDYANDPGADGFGIYLVFWFGHDWQPTPPRPDGGPRSTSASELEELLLQDLPSYLQARTDVVVFDVSRPKAALAKKRKAGRMSRGQMQRTG
jgi:hypothetical protein